MITDNDSYLIQDVRPAHDADDDPRLKKDPSDEDAQLDVALDESFPSSDPPSLTQPCKGKDHFPVSGDVEAVDLLRNAPAPTD